MIRDTLRAVLAVAVMAAAASIVLETRLRLAAIDAAHRATLAGHATPAWPQAHATPATATPPGPLHRLGRATLDLADAALGVVR